MSDPWLLLDVHFMCYRAFHVMGHLSYKELKTGVVYGFLRDVIDLQERFGTERVAFAFDVGVPKRRALLPGYKLKRHTRQRAPQEEQAHRGLQHQIQMLRTSYLERIGYRNLFWEDGYEADDIIASITYALPETDDAIIVSSDGDMNQLLDSGITIYSPTKQRLTSVQTFQRQYGIGPQDWATVRALSGCNTDEVPGVKGVGEKTAIRWLQRQIKPTAKVAQAIASQAGRETLARNLRLVQLPFKGTPAFPLVQDELSVEGWQSVCRELGLRSLVDRTPFTGRGNRRRLVQQHGQGQ